MGGDRHDAGEARAALGVTRPSTAPRRVGGARAPVTPTARVVLIEDRPLVGLGLTGLLDTHGIKVVGEARNAQSGLAYVQQTSPDATLVDLESAAAALQAARALIRSGSRPRVALIVATPDDRTVLEALAAGAYGCVGRDAPPEDIVAAVQAAVREERFLSPGIRGRLAHQLGLTRNAPRGGDELTPREREVLRLIARGWHNTRIGQELYVSQATVKHHVTNIFLKLDVDNRVQAAVRAVQDDLLDSS